MPGFNPDQPRDEKGQWTDTGTASAIQTAASDKKEYYVNKFSGHIAEKGSGKVVAHLGKLTKEEVQQYGVGEWDYNEEFGGWYQKGNVDSVLGRSADDINIDKVTTEAQAEEIMNKLVENKKFTDDEVSYVNEYTGDAYIYINKHYRHGQPPLSDHYERAVAHIDSFLNKAPRYEGVSYRGLAFRSDDAYNAFKKDLTDDNIMLDNAYGSTTVRKGEIDSFRGYSYSNSVEITIKGKSGVFLSSSISRHADEKEVLFPRQTSFKVTHVREVEKTDGFGNRLPEPKRYLYVEMEEIE